MPSGTVNLALTTDENNFSVPPGQEYVSLEAGRGELGLYLVSQGKTMPYRIFLRTPSFPLLALAQKHFKGLTCQELPLWFASFTPSPSEIEK